MPKGVHIEIGYGQDEISEGSGAIELKDAARLPAEGP